MELFKNLFKIEVKVTEKLEKAFKETRHYSFDSLKDRIYPIGSWNSINISNNQELMQKLWDNHISKISHLHYYLSDQGIECTVETPRGKNFLTWAMTQGQPIWFEYGIYDSSTRYDISYPKDFDKVPELKAFLISHGNRFRKIYLADKNL